MQRIFARKEKLNCTLKNCMVSMATVNVILDDVCTYKIDHIGTVAGSRLLSLVSLLSLDISLLSCGK